MSNQTIALNSQHSNGQVQIFSNQSGNQIDLSTLMQPQSSFEHFVISSVMEGKVIDVDHWSAQNPGQNHAEQLSPNFLSELFSSKAHQRLIGYKGCKIQDLKAPELEINMHFNELSYPVEFQNCQFKYVRVQGVTTRARLRFKDCQIEVAKVRNLVTEDDLHFYDCKITKLRFDNIRVYGDLILKGTHADSIEVYGGKVVGEFSLKDTQLDGALLASLEVEGVTNINGAAIRMFKVNGGSSGRLFQAKSAVFDSVAVISLKAAGSFRFDGSTVNDEINIMSIDVRGNAMFNGMTINQIGIWGGLFQGVFQICNSKVISSLTMQRSSVEGTLFLRGTELSCNADFSFTNIKNSFCMESLSFKSEGNSFDLSGVEIKGDLRFYQDDDEYTPHPWGNQKLILRNCSTKSFQDHPEIWPSEIDFTGFEYEQISGRNKNSSKGKSTVSFADRPISWIIGLLARQKKFNPQPYWQLARVMGQIGYEQKSTRILYECAKERRKNNPAFFARNFKRLHFMINGYGYYNFRVLYWCLLLIACGMGVLYTTGEAARLNLNYGFLYSIDMLIPIVEFSKKYYTESYALQNYPAELYFFFHEMMGYLFAFMVASGLSTLAREKR